MTQRTENVRSKRTTLTENEQLETIKRQLAEQNAELELATAPLGELSESALEIESDLLMEFTEATERQVLTATPPPIGFRC